MQSVDSLKESLAKLSNGVLVPPKMRCGPDGMPDEYDRNFIMNLLGQQLAFNNLASTMGFPCELDYTLCTMLNQTAAQNGANPAAVNRQGVEYRMMLLLIADNAVYRIDLDACANNAHCIVYAVNTLLIALVSMLRPGECETHYLNLFATTSSNLLRMGLECGSCSLVLNGLGASAVGNSGTELAGKAGSTGSSESSGISSLSGGGSNGEVVNMTTSGTMSSSWGQQNCKMRDSIYLVFHQLMSEAPFVPANVQEAFFPYSLVRAAYHNLAKFSKTPLVMIAKETPLNAQEGIARSQKS
ncbi:Nck-associated protein 1 [Cichlidogyrus casuarinus]|uniref:Nck-associated protein 1 n=1 Tax=Cichlidogyrus casuarinus TaxID=1844966 RepID=A0ABD2QJ12_9PLAT